MSEEYDHEHFPANFYQGWIIRLERGRGRGLIKSEQGREIPFEFPHVIVIGARPGGRHAGIDLLREGDLVGFDVGRTSKGLRVTTIKPAVRTEGT